MQNRPSILIVDDKSANLLALGAILEPLDVLIVKAQTGEEALRQTLKCQFALAILDVQMPSMNGYELAEFLRGDERTRETPLIFLTAVHNDDMHEFQGYRAGAVDFITKPFNPDILLAKVRIFLELHRRREELERMVAAQAETNAKLAREIAQRSKIEALLQKAKDQADEGNRAKGEFLSNMSHEIRTPLNGVLGMLQILKGSHLPEEQQRYVGNALDAGQRLLTLLNDILDFSKMEAGVLTLHAAPFSLAGIFQATTSIFEQQCKAKGLDLEIRIDESVPRRMVGDEARLQQVIFNLVGNAVKFTKAGFVRVLATAKPAKTPQTVLLTLTVSDSGPGIPESEVLRIFERFTRGSTSYTRTVEGTGLGLAIVKRIADLLGGGVSVSSHLGKGTTIDFSVPLPAADVCDAEPDLEPVAAVRPCSSPLRALRILLVDDEPIGRLGMEVMLKRMGHTVAIAENGLQALEAVRNGEFDCVLMDVQMPELDGLGATQIIRNEPSLAARRDVPIIALTAYAMEEERRNFLAVGMNAHVAKPVQQSEIEAMLRLVAEGVFRPKAC